MNATGGSSTPCWSGRPLGEAIHTNVDWKNALHCFLPAIAMIGLICLVSMQWGNQAVARLAESSLVLSPVIRDGTTLELATHRLAVTAAGLAAHANVAFDTSRWQSNWVAAAIALTALIGSHQLGRMLSSATRSRH